MAIKGIDYAWGFPDPAAVKAAGFSFVMRYFSHDTGKNLDPEEARALTKAGIWIGVVWESTANRAIQGYNAGKQDAKDALAQATACQMSGDRPIFFAVDFDAETNHDLMAIGDYLDGAASVIGKDRVGLYAGYTAMKWAFDAKKIAYGWQTYAWSTNRWDARTHIHQYSNGHKVGGVDCDYNVAVRDDYGQWMIGESAMALSDTDVAKIVKAIWTTDGAIPPSGYASVGNPTWEYVNVLRTAATESHAANDTLHAVMQKMDELLAAVKAIVDKETAEVPPA